MQITRLRIQNFRSIKNLDLDLTGTTVLIGPNNAGKTAILDALRIALTRKWGQRGTGFTEYDFRLETDESDPKEAPPITIEVELAEATASEWGEDLLADLADVIQVDPLDGRGIIILRVSCVWDSGENSYVPKWEFLGSDRKPATGKGARTVNTSKFFEYIPVFYLDALRDADDEFSARSQFWGRLLKSVSIPEKLSARVQQVFDRVNTRLLGADPKIANISETLNGISRIASEDDPGSVAIRMAPFKTWDLLSRAQVIVRTTSERPWLPVGRHGRGVQSLSVIFLFHAFVGELLKGLFHADTEPFLALEEPETHLHPQAARTLWRHVQELPGQKLVTTHSPYFVQHVPFRDLRLIKAGAEGTTYSALPSFFDADVPSAANVLAYLATLPGDVSYDNGARRLRVKGKLAQPVYNRLVDLYTAHADFATIKPQLDSLFSRSQTYVDDRMLRDLEVYARRIRGEIFFARRWLLVEGPSEYILAHAVGEASGYSLDANGVAVIDFQNNGNVRSFAVLARALGIPWISLFDNDAEGARWLVKLGSAGFDAADLAKRFLRHAEIDLEAAFAVQDETAFRRVAELTGIANAPHLPVADVLVQVRTRKTDFAVRASEELRTGSVTLASFPLKLVEAVASLRELD